MMETTSSGGTSVANRKHDENFRSGYETSRKSAMTSPSLRFAGRWTTDEVRAASLILCLGILLATIHDGIAERRIVCYYTNWSVYRPGTAKFSPQNINPYLCTHLIYAFGGFTKENALKPFDKYQDIEKGGYAKFTGLKTYNKNLKTMLAIGGWNEGSSRFSPMVADPARRREFVKNAVKFLRQNHFDGLDLDWEYPAFRDGGKPRDKDNYADLVQELREEFERESSKTGRSRLLLSMAMPAGVEYIDKGYDVLRLNEYLDFINLLSYDYHSAYEPAVNHHSPLYPLEEDNEYNYDAELTIDYTITHLLEKGASADKVVLGIPTYGRSYTLFNQDATELGSPADGPGTEGEATREKGYLAYYEICESIIDSDEWEVVQPNPKAMGPYAFKDNQWVGYDDEDIVKLKAHYVNEKKLGGIMFWSIDNDDFRGKCHGRPYPLIEAAKEALLTDSRNTIDKTKSVDSRKKTRTQNTQSSTRKSIISNRRSTTSAPIISKRVSSSRPKYRTISQASKEEQEDREVSRRSYDPSSDEDTEGRNTVRVTEKTERPKSHHRSKTQSGAADRTTRRKHSRRKGQNKTGENEESISNKLTTPEPPTTPDPGTDFKCEDEGFFPHPRDCKKYFWCLDSGPGGLGVVAHQFVCPSGLVFNKGADSCDYPRNVICPKTSKTSIVSTTRSPITAATSRTTYLHSTTTAKVESEEYDSEEDDSLEEDDEIEENEEIEEEEEEEEKRKEEPVTTTTTRPLVYKTLTRNRPSTTTTTTTSKPSEPERVDSEDEEDPKVIKELIDLIKKAGGIEELEKQLLFQEKNSDTKSGSESVTPATISRSLYERVLNRQTNRIGNHRPVLSSSETSYVNGPGRAQFEGLDDIPEVKSLRRSQKPQYVTIERSKSITKESSSENEDINEDEEDNTDVASFEGKSISNPLEDSLSTQRVTPSYVNIRRTRPSTTTSKIENDVEGKEIEIEEEKSTRRRRPIVSSKQHDNEANSETSKPFRNRDSGFRKSEKREDKSTNQSADKDNDSSTTKTRYSNIQRFRSTTLKTSEGTLSSIIPLSEISETTSPTRLEEYPEVSRKTISTTASLSTTPATTTSTSTEVITTISVEPPENPSNVSSRTDIDSTTDSMKLVEDSATEILFTTLPAISSSSSQSTTTTTTTLASRSTIAAVSQPRPFGFTRRRSGSLEATTTATTPLSKSKDIVKGTTLRNKSISTNGFSDDTAEFWKHYTTTSLRDQINYSSAYIEDAEDRKVGRTEFTENNTYRLTPIVTRGPEIRPRYKVPIILKRPFDPEEALSPRRYPPLDSAPEESEETPETRDARLRQSGFRQPRMRYKLLNRNNVKIEEKTTQPSTDSTSTWQYFRTRSYPKRTSTIKPSVTRLVTSVTESGTTERQKILIKTKYSSLTSTTRIPADQFPPTTPLSTLVTGVNDDPANEVRHGVERSTLPIEGEFNYRYDDRFTTESYESSTIEIESIVFRNLRIVADSEAIRLPTLKELIGYPTTYYDDRTATTSSSVLLHLLRNEVDNDISRQNVEKLLRETDESQDGEKEIAQSSRDINEETDDSWLQQASENRARSRTLRKDDVMTTNFDEQVSVTNTIQEDETKRKTSTNSVYLKPTTMRGISLVSLISSPVMRGFYITRSENVSSILVDNSTPLYTTTDIPVEQQTETILISDVSMPDETVTVAYNDQIESGPNILDDNVINDKGIDLHEEKYSVFNSSMTFSNAEISNHEKSDLITVLVDESTSKREKSLHNFNHITPLFNSYDASSTMPTRRKIALDVNRSNEVITPLWTGRRIVVKKRNRTTVSPIKDAIRQTESDSIYAVTNTLKGASLTTEASTLTSRNKLSTASTISTTSLTVSDDFTASPEISSVYNNLANSNAKTEDSESNVTETVTLTNSIIAATPLKTIPSNDATTADMSTFSDDSTIMNVPVVNASVTTSSTIAVSKSPTVATELAIIYTPTTISTEVETTPNYSVTDNPIIENAIVTDPATTITFAANTESEIPSTNVNIIPETTTLVTDHVTDTVTNTGVVTTSIPVTAQEIANDSANMTTVQTTNANIDITSSITNYSTDSIPTTISTHDNATIPVTTSPLTIIPSTVNTQHIHATAPMTTNNLADINTVTTNIMTTPLNVVIPTTTDLNVITSSINTNIPSTSSTSEISPIMIRSKNNSVTSPKTLITNTDITSTNSDVSTILTPESSTIHLANSSNFNISSNSEILAATTIAETTEITEIPITIEIPSTFTSTVTEYPKPHSSTNFEASSVVTTTLSTQADENSSTPVITQIPSTPLSITTLITNKTIVTVEQSTASTTPFATTDELIAINSTIRTTTDTYKSDFVRTISEDKLSSAQTMRNEFTAPEIKVSEETISKITENQKQNQTELNTTNYQFNQKTAKRRVLNRTNNWLGSPTTLQKTNEYPRRQVRVTLYRRRSQRPAAHISSSKAIEKNRKRRIIQKRIRINSEELIPFNNTIRSDQDTVDVQNITDHAYNQVENMRRRKVVLKKRIKEETNTILPTEETTVFLQTSTVIENETLQTHYENENIKEKQEVILKESKENLLTTKNISINSSSANKSFPDNIQNNLYVVKDFSKLENPKNKSKSEEKNLIEGERVDFDSINTNLRNNFPKSSYADKNLSDKRIARRRMRVILKNVRSKTEEKNSTIEETNPDFANKINFQNNFLNNHNISQNFSNEEKTRRKMRVVFKRIKSKSEEEETKTEKASTEDDFTDESLQDTFSNNFRENFPNLFNGEDAQRRMEDALKSVKSTSKERDSVAEETVDSDFARKDSQVPNTFHFLSNLHMGNNLPDKKKMMKHSKSEEEETMTKQEDTESQITRTSVPVEKDTDRFSLEVTNGKSINRNSESGHSNRRRKPTPFTTIAPLTNTLSNTVRRRRPVETTISSRIDFVDAFEGTESYVKPATVLHDQNADVSDQSIRAQEFAVTLSDPPSSTSDIGRTPLRDVDRRKISTTVIPRTDLTTSRTVSRYDTNFRSRQRSQTKDRPTVNATTRPRRPPVIDYDYYEDEVPIVIGKSVLNSKLFLTSKGTIRCMDQGNFPHPYSCKKFITCARMVNGQVIGTEYTCPDKLSFDPVGGICNWSAGLGCKD
ncbi:CHIT1 protein, partial [Acromyrmex charruanus]